MKVWANTDGKTMHAELSTEPVQLEVSGKDGKKSWQPVDTTIAAKEDGTLAAKLVKTPLTFGGEGDRTLVTAKDKDGSVTIGWDRELPKPAVNGNKITYRDAVAEGADLVLTARPNGFAQEVVLRTPPQEHIKVNLPITLPKGRTFGKAADGKPQLMSAQGTAESAPLATQAIDAKAAEAPGQGKIGKVDATVTTDASGKSSLVLTPDAAFLADAAVTYPVVVPMSGEWIGAGDSSDTFVSSVQYPNSATLFTWLRAGKSADGELWRTYLRYVINGTDLDYATIIDADLRLWNYHASGCGTTVGVGIVARRLTLPYDYSTLTWGNQPSSTGTDAVVAPGGYSNTLAGCSGSGELYHSIQNIVQEWANGTPDHGLMIRAATEGAAGANWRQYRSDQYTGSDGRGPVLFIDYEPAPRASIVYSALTEQTTNPTYEEAVALQDYQPEEIENVAVSDQFTALLQESRNTGDAAEAYPVGTDKLDTSGAEGDPEKVGDDEAPIITSVTPSPGAAGVPVGTTLSATFSENIVGASVSLKAADGTEVSGTTSADGTGTKVIFTPAAPLASGVQYTATVSGAQDIWDNTVDDYSWTFTTVSDCPPRQDPDTTAPSIRSHHPAADATGAGTGSQVSVSFCEPVQDPVLTLKGATGTIVQGSMSLDQAATTVTFTPTAPLTADTRYTAEISGASDAADNVMTAYSWSFTTAPTVPPDTTPPSVTQTTPPNGAVDVALSTQLRVSYSEPVTGAQVTLAESGGATVTGTVSMAEDDVAVFTPSAPLKAGTTYTATAGGATDAAGNTQTAHSWSFTTIAAAAQPVNPNPYFESEIDPWYTYFEEDELTRSTERAHEGTASAKFVPLEGTWGAAAETFEISEGTAYGLSGWFYQAATSLDGFNFGIEWYDVGFELLSVDNFPIDENIGQWQQVSGQVSAPAGAAYAVVYVNGSATIYFDEVTLIPANALAAALGSGAVKKAREHGRPSSLYLPEGQTRHKPKAATRVEPSATAEPGKTAVAATTPFNYEHISMEDCLEVARQAGIDPTMGRGNVAHLVVRPYSTCWSRYINVIDYVFARKVGKWIASAGKKDSVRLQFQATWVMHTYLGNATGDGVVNGGTSGLKPQQIKLWTKISNVKTYTVLDNVTTGDDDELLKLEVKPTADSGSTCTMVSGSSRQTSLSGWKADGDDEFLFTMQDTDGDKADKCTLRPTMVDVDDEWTFRPMYLWSQVAYDQKGQILGKHNGGGDPSGNDPNEKPYTPHVRCDWYRVSNADPEGEGTVAAAAATTAAVHTGACIFPLAKRIFIMSKSKDASFRQVIDHIEAALKQNTGVSDNRYTVPPLRDNETQDPPLKGVLGTEKTKSIPGNWAAPMGTDPNKVEPGDPLTKDKAGNQSKNRNVFTRSFRVGGTQYTSYCQYYYPENYREPLLSLLDPVYKKAECDEYPFASTKNGAGYAADNGMKNHYSLRAVGKSHNSTATGSHGRALGSFYTRNRVLADDKFWVWIVN
ncbi:Ig-like domain-containing protein [Nonomuraea angiospora]|uniref:Ig-like domain-containing protein n=1 Tax=Nonomuraea angiospora TaxID=46172 RepID=UPI0037A6C0D1